LDALRQNHQRSEHLDQGSGQLKSTSKFKLRPYQKEAIQAVQSDWAAGMHNVLVTAASGTGKTEIFSALLATELEKKPDARALILCHRRDLITQARHRLTLRFPHLDAGIVMAEQDEADCDIVYSTVQTLVSDGRLEEVLKYGPITHLIRDEAHRAVTPTDRGLFHRLRQANPELLHLGVTATPIRYDKKGLIEAYEKESYHYGIREAVKEATLVPPKWLPIQTGIDVSQVKKYKKDFLTWLTSIPVWIANHLGGTKVASFTASRIP